MEKSYYQLKAEYDKLLEFATYWHQRALGNIGDIEAASKLPAPLIDRLIHFCHPDKHDNSNVANELTQELLKIRKRNI